MAEVCMLCGGDTLRRRLFVKRRWSFVRCEVCGLVSLSPLPVPTDIATHHEASYQTGAYAAFAAATSIRRGIASHRLQLILPLATGGPWLDVGCSSGAFVAEAVRAGIDAEGVELSLAAATLARDAGLTVHRAALESFAPTRRYGVVTALDVVEHLPDPRSLVRCAAAWLLPGGLLALTLPDISSLSARILGRYWPYYAPPDHVHYFTPHTIGRLLAGGGFRDVRVTPVPKPLTLDYAAAALADLSPGLASAASAILRVLPPSLRRRSVPLRLGEMLVTARADDGGGSHPPGSVDPHSKR